MNLKDDKIETILYLIRHSKQMGKNEFENYTCQDTTQMKNEKTILSVEGEIKAKRLSELDELKNIDTVWTSNYVRSIVPAKYIANQNHILLNLDESFNEQKYGIPKENEDKTNFWIKQYLNSNHKNIKGESQEEVRQRMYLGIQRILKNFPGEKGCSRKPWNCNIIFIT